MAFALIPLGLLPLVFLGDVRAGDSTAGEDEAEAENPDDVALDTGEGDFFANDDDTTGDMSVEDGTVLEPVIDDEMPIEGDPVDPATVLEPVFDDPTPVEGGPVDPETVLDPNDDPADEFPIIGEGTFLQQALLAETDSFIGVGYLGTRIGADDSNDTALTDGDDRQTEPDDGVEGTGEGHLDSWDGTPILVTAGGLRVIAGGAGNDSITTGDGAAYVFGEAGDDTLAAGEGVAALFGGSGDDTLTGTGTGTGATAWLDGGDGDDRLFGGAAAETLDGGAHGAGDGSVQDNDTLIMDRADSATGGEGADTFWVYFDTRTGIGAAAVTDFQQGEDFLRVTLNPELGLDDPEVTVGPSADGQDGVVSVNGNVVAILRGVPGATENDVYAEVVADSLV